MKLAGIAGQPSSPHRRWFRPCGTLLISFLIPSGCGVRQTGGLWEARHLSPEKSYGPIPLWCAEGGCGFVLQMLFFCHSSRLFPEPAGPRSVPVSLDPAYLCFWEGCRLMLIDARPLSHGKPQITRRGSIPLPLFLSVSSCPKATIESHLKLP